MEEAIIIWAGNDKDYSSELAKIPEKIDYAL